MSNKASLIVVLCEDPASDVCICRFLKKGWKLNNRDISVRPYPRDKGSAKQFVLDNLAREVTECRGRSASTILIVMMDADQWSVAKARQELASRIEPPRTDNEQIAFIIPKWHIETWVAYLDGQTVLETEKRTYKNRYSKMAETKKAHALIDALAGDCRQNAALTNPPPSLVVACEEFERIRGALT